MSNAFLKSTFCGVSAFCAILAVTLAGGGIWCSLKLKELTDLRNFESIQLDFQVYWPQILPYIFVGVGILGLFVALCGFCGGAGSRACLITYNICAIFVILAMIGAGIAAILVGTQHSDEFLTKTFHNVFQEAISNKPYVRERFSQIESSMHCCGADGPQNYIAARLPYPASCCDGGTDCSIGLNPRRGCIQVFSVYTKWAFYIGAAGSCAIVIFAILSMCLSIALIRRMRSKIVS